MKNTFFNSFLVHDFSSKFDNTGLPNFYREAAILSQRKLKSKISTIEDISLNKYLKFILNILKKFIKQEFLYSIINYKKFNSFIFLTSGGLITIIFLRILGLNKKCFLILYDIPFIQYYDFKKRKFNLKFNKYFFKLKIFKYFLNFNINFVFLNYQQLRIFREIYSRDKNSDFSFTYGVDLNYYSKFIANNEREISISGFNLNNNYLLFVGSAYRNRNLLRKISLDTYFEKSKIKLVTSRFVPNKKNSFLSYADGIYNFYNLSSIDYLNLILSSKLILISSERSDTMAGLTSFLECYALGKKIFLTPTIYDQEYLNLMRSSRINIVEVSEIIEKLKLYFLKNHEISDDFQDINNILDVESCTNMLIRKLSKFH